jgi:hypothetical protein
MAEEVAHRRGEHVHQTGERPQREQRNGGNRVELEAQRGANHQLRLRVEVEDAAEPDRHPFPVVVVPHHPGGCVHQSAHDHDSEHQVHDLVHHGGCPHHRLGEAAPVEQSNESHNGEDPGNGTHRDRHEVVGPIRNAHGICPDLGDAKSHDMAEEDGQDAKVEHRVGPAQDAALVHLARARGPSELVIAVAPDMPQDKDRQADVGENQPQEYFPSVVHHVPP